MSDLTGMAAQIAADLSDPDEGVRISYLDVLDALATSGLTLTVDEEQNASKTYAVAVEMEGLLI